MSTCVRGLPANCGGGAQVSSGRRSAIVSMVAMVAAGIAGPWCVVICHRPYAAVATNRAYFSVFGKPPAGRPLSELWPGWRVFPLRPSFRLIAPWPQGPRRVKHSFDFRWEPAPQTDIVPPPPLFLPGIGAARERRRWALYSHLRFVIAAALIAFGSVIAVGVPALLLAVDRPLLAQNDVSEPPAASSCGQQGWLHFDRNCSQRGLPWAAARRTANAGPVEAPLEPAADQPLTEGRQAATAPELSAPQFSMRQLSEPQLFAPQISVPQSFTSPGHGGPGRPSPRVRNP